MKSAVYVNGKRKSETEFKVEDQFEEFVVENSKTIFGNKTVFINAKKLIKSKILGSAIPDGFLIDLSDKENPGFYIVEVELSSHDFYEHIFPQVTKYISFYKNEESRTRLLNAVWTAINEAPEALKDLKSQIGESEVFKLLRDIIDESQNILIILDEMKPEFEEIAKTYTDTWDKLIRIILVRNYGLKEEGVITVTPGFEQIEYLDAPSMEEKDIGKETAYSEEYHLESVSPEIKDIYYILKKEMSLIQPKLIFNPQKYYISIKENKNFAFLRFSKRKIRIAVLIDEDLARSLLKYHKPKHLSEAVQKFWNGSSCELVVEDKNNLSEITGVLEQARKLQN